MVFSRMGWCSGGAGPEGGPDDQHHSASGRFCLCIGDDVSDEDMFIAVKVSLGLNTTRIGRK